MFKNGSSGQWFQWMFLKHEAFSSGSPQEMTRAFIVFLLSYLGRFMLLVRMETTLHLHHTHHKPFTLRTGSCTPELIRTTTKVKMCTVLLWEQMDDHHSVKQLHFACRCLRWTWSQPCCYPGAPAGQRWRCGFGHARRSGNWFGSRLPLLCLLVFLCDLNLNV